jgi:hypothetical protein
MSGYRLFSSLARHKSLCERQWFGKDYAARSLSVKSRFYWALTISPVGCREQD